ncbi:hypothetical protein [Glutamicibacter sp. FBE19]|uniref:hypothetical protein n=1 Tax=Glutamicibacter sp. FBE19 TaxID=2761534 RepID=UPI0018965EB8|nr:hypothetical protein [Glutamicibacter sp. FBE19]MBF6672446.1 hypothetical protein [Glutamicibacter sp. FBE19]
MAEKKFEVKRPTRLVSVCLNGDLTAEFETVKDKLTEALRAAKADQRLNGSPVRALEERHADLYAAQQEQTIVFKLRGLPRHKWDELKTAHPARNGHEVDEQYGFNTSTLFESVMLAEGTIDEVTQLDEPVEFTAEDWAEIASELTDGQWGDFAQALVELNAGRQLVPFSSAGYKKIQASAAKSK